jgi:hypothetical protein
VAEVAARRSIPQIEKTSVTRILFYQLFAAFFSPAHQHSRVTFVAAVSESYAGGIPRYHLACNSKSTSASTPLRPNAHLAAPERVGNAQEQPKAALSLVREVRA